MTSVSELQSLSSVPKLETNGSNWIIFQTQLKWALEDKQVFGHLDGTAIKPADTEKDEEKKETWLINETKARQLLAQKLYDSTLTKLLHYKTVVEMWAVITQEYSIKSGHVVAAMTTLFNSLKCVDNANVRAHLDKLRLKYEELIGVGITISATDYATCIIGSLPAKYQHHLSTIEASAHASAVAAAAANPANPTAIAAAKSFSVSADLLIQLTTEEYDKIQSAPGQQGSKAAKADTGVALSAQRSGTGNRGGKTNQKPHLARNGKPFGVCWNCGGKGHLAKDCPSPEQGSAGSSDRGKKKSEENCLPGGSANVATPTDLDGAWSTASLSDLFNDDDVTDMDSVNSVESSLDITWDHVPSYLSDTSLSSVSEGSMPGLVSVSNSSDSVSSDSTSMPDLQAVSESDGSSDGDWFSEVEENTLGDDPRVDSVETSFATVMADVSDEEVNSVAAALTEILQPAGCAELFNSGSTEHLSPYCDQFTTYRETPPKSFTTANKQNFQAVGAGDMVIEVPAGLDVSKMTLNEVLYSPEIGYTLISVGRLDDAGFTTTFGQGECEVRDSNGDLVGTIPKSVKGLYRVVHESVDPSYADSANAATAHLSLMEFHRCMGHISPAVAERLVSKGFVTGVSLDTSGTDGPVFCESCVFVKSHHESISKVHKGERATEFGGEIHSDVWGPAPVDSLGGRRYFVSFTDDYSRLTHVYLLHHKSDTFEAYKTFKA
jgi:gag-polypeptide of LTR copia-type/Zinc knuckle